MRNREVLAMKIATIIVALCGVFIGARLSHAQAAVCGGADTYSTAQLTRIRQLLAGTDSVSASVRAGYRLPVVAASQVQLVANDSVCAVASNALRQTLDRTDLPLATTWVIRVGADRYWVYDVRIKSAIDVVHAVFDQSWTNLALITG